MLTSWNRARLTTVVAMTLITMCGPQNAAAQVCVQATAQVPLVDTPYDVATGDFDGDGDVDIALSTYAHNVSLLINTGIGDFSTTPLGFGAFEEGLAAADLNGDGLVDLAATSYGTSQLRVHLNQGNGAFAAPVAYATGPGPHPESADLNGDGALDLVTTNYTGGTISVFLNQGGGAFAAQVSYPVGNRPASVAFVDLDADGYLDMVVGNSLASTVSVLRNLGNGSFAPQVPHVVGTTPYSAVAADLDGDGDKDIAVVLYVDNAVSVSMNQGNGSLGPAITYPIGFRGSSMVAADVDGDGDADLVVTAGYAPVMEVLENHSDGTFGAPIQYQLIGAGPALSSADFDGDGDPDLAIGITELKTCSVLTNCTNRLQAFCFGDGSDTACPCNNPGVVGRGCENAAATGGARLVLQSGTASVSLDTLRLSVTGLVPFAPGLFYQGSATASPSAPFGVAFGNGLRCVGGATNRLEIRFADGSGVMNSTVALGTSGAAIAGNTYYYQQWYRDAGNVGTCTPGSGFNLSNALSLTWQP